MNLFSSGGFDSLISVTSTEAGEADGWNLTIGAVSEVSSVSGAWFRAVGETNTVSLIANVGDPDDNNGLEFAGTQTDGLLTLSYQGDVLTKIHPTITTSGTAIAYMFNTSHQLTNGDNIVSFQNTNAVRFAVDHAGAVTAAAGVTAGALVTGTGFVSASGYAAVGSTNRWQTGIVTTGATVALNLTNYVNITINGVTYKLGLVQ